eukprot:gene20502-24357_t
MPWLTVEQNIGFSDDDGYDKAWVAQLIDEVGLTGFGQALPKALSGGMAQRVAIARGLYSRPQVLLLDEPFSAVDAFTRMKLQDLLLDRVLVMDNRPSSIRQELAVELVHPRDRRDPLLARLKALALTELQRAHVI